MWGYFVSETANIHLNQWQENQQSPAYCLAFKRAETVEGNFFKEENVILTKKLF